MTKIKEKKLLTDTKIVKKRGRKPKLTMPEIKDEKLLTDTKIVKKRGPKPKLTMPEIKDKKLLTDTKIVKKRGRKPKLTMPEIKDKKLLTDTKIVKKRGPKPKEDEFKFDIREILRERQLKAAQDLREAPLLAEIKRQTDLIDQQLRELEEEDRKKQEEYNSISSDEEFDNANYHIVFNALSYSCPKECCSQRLLVMSKESDYLTAKLHFNCLVKAIWSLKFEDFKKVLHNWSVDSETLTNGTPFEDQKTYYKNIGQHNMELVIKLIVLSILENNNGFSHNDLLTFAKFASVLLFDDHFGQLSSVIKQLFYVSIDKALDENDDAIITCADELFSKLARDDVLKIIKDIFLPMTSPKMKRMYTYLTFKTFKSLLQITNNINSFPTTIYDWFIQDSVDTNYFRGLPKITILQTIKLIEHVVISFNLYQDVKKMHEMYKICNGAIDAACGSGPLNGGVYINIIDQWRLKLFALNLKKNAFKI